VEQTARQFWTAKNMSDEGEVDEAKIGESFGFSKSAWEGSRK
jgi:hypothetical protein